ncbi:MAG: PAS domain-containing protein [Candidatus Binatia bacterium]
MAQKEIEVILMRQLASYLATPIFLVDPEGTLIFYNEAAEAILGLRFEETGEMPAAEWATAFTPTDESGEPLARETLPLSVALSQGRPSQSSLWIRGLDQVPRYIEVTAFPVLGQRGRSLGAVAIFHEIARGPAGSTGAGGAASAVPEGSPKR